MAHDQRDGLWVLAMDYLRQVLGVGFAERVYARHLGTDGLEKTLGHAFAGFRPERGQQHRGCALDAARTQDVGTFGFVHEVVEYGLTLLLRRAGEQADLTRDV